MKPIPKITLKKVVNDLYFMFCSKDNKLSIRKVLATLFSAGLLHMSILHITNCREVQEAFIWGFISLIVALLGLTTWQNLKDNHNSNSNSN